MNLEQLQQKLLAAARANPPGDRVPYAFEKRITARLSARPACDGWAMWAHALWRAAASCVAITLLLWAWSFVAANHPAASTSVAAADDFPQHFEQTMLAAVNESEDVW